MYQTIIIDDEKWVIKSLLATLQTIEGVDQLEFTAEFENGISALEYLCEHKPALAFVDIRLPGMTGLELLQKAGEMKLPTLFIMISGHAEFEYARTALLHNAVGYCLKPFSREELSSSLKKALQQLSLLYPELSESNRKMDTADSSQDDPLSRELLAQGTTKNKAVSFMLSYTNAHYMDNISVQTLAELCSINPNYAGQLFRQSVGQTFNSYLSDLRIKHAIHLLMTTDIPVAVIASTVGYQDYFYFAKVFKKQTGQTPSSYRQEEDLFIQKGDSI